MTDDLVARVMDGMGSLVDAIDHDGAAYARGYALWLRGTGPPPHKPSTLPSPIARVIRDLVLEEAHVKAPLVRSGMLATT